MSKIRNLFNKILKKNKNSQDSDRESDPESEEGFFDDIESESLEAAKKEDDNLEIDDLELEEELTHTPTPPITKSNTDVTSEFGEELLEDDKLASPSDEVTKAAFNIDELNLNGARDEESMGEELDENEELEPPPPEVTNIAFNLDELKAETPEFTEMTRPDHEANNTLDDSLDVPIDQTQNSITSSVTKTKVLDLTQTGVNLKDKIDHFKTRIIDQFRNLTTKDFNKAFKSKNKKLSFEDIKSQTMSINWANIPNMFFSRTNRNKIHKLFQSSLILIIIISIAKISGSILSGSPDYKSLRKRSSISFKDSNQFSRSDINTLKSAGIFKTQQVIKDNKKVAKPTINLDKVCLTATKRSKASVKLVNTIVLQDSVKSIASVQVRSSSKLQSIREGDTLLGQIKIDRIENFKLVVKNLRTGECESIENEIQKRKRKKTTPLKVLTAAKSKEYKKKLAKIDGIKTDGTNFKIKKKYLKSKLSDIGSLLTQAKGIPLKNPDGTLSFKIVEIEPGSIFSYLGIEDSDVITRINGEPIKDMSEVMSLFGGVADLSNLNLTINRNGEETTQNYSIE